MADTFVLFYRFNFKEAFYQLSDEEKKAFGAKMDEGQEKFGVKKIVHCNSRWATEQWRGFGVEEYPSFEALQAYSKWQEEMSLYRYLDVETMLGSKAE